ncbi:hypothetical protein [Streptomyces sp. NPDC059593]|uniref:hypothetical protein n=1 Tax=Streptomyces sp. NPDC059593 TaxID=3346878 RepID=UPI00368CCFC8
MKSGRPHWTGWSGPRSSAAADNGKYTKGQKVTLNRISGYRDGYPTERPGNNLYAGLPAIRALASAAQAS